MGHISFTQNNIFESPYLPASTPEDIIIDFPRANLSAQFKLPWYEAKYLIPKGTANKYLSIPDIPLSQGCPIGQETLENFINQQPNSFTPISAEVSQWLGFSRGIITVNEKDPGIIYKFNGIGKCTEFKNEIRIEPASDCERISDFDLKPGIMKGSVLNENGTIIMNQNQSRVGAFEPTNGQYKIRKTLEVAQMVNGEISTPEFCGIFATENSKQEATISRFPVSYLLNDIWMVENHLFSNGSIMQPYLTNLALMQIFGTLRTAHNIGFTHNQFHTGNVRFLPRAYNRKATLMTDLSSSIDISAFKEPIKTKAKKHDLLHTLGSLLRTVTPNYQLAIFPQIVAAATIGYLPELINPTSDLFEEITYEQQVIAEDLKKSPDLIRGSLNYLATSFNACR